MQNRSKRITKQPAKFQQEAEKKQVKKVEQEVKQKSTQNQVQVKQKSKVEIQKKQKSNQKVEKQKLKQKQKKNEKEKETDSGSGSEMELEQDEKQDNSEQKKSVQKSQQQIEECRYETQQGGNVRLFFGKSRFYTFDLEDDLTRSKKNLLEVLEDFEIFIPLVNAKNKKKVEKISEVVDHFHFTQLEYFLFRFQELLEAEKKKWNLQEDNCTICQCEWYEEIEKCEKNDLVNFLQKDDENDCLGLINCQNHYFHQQCLIQCIQEKHIKCPVCYQIYGVMTGDQPAGTMNYSVNKNTHCSGYNNVGTIIISYSFPSGVRNGKHYSGTHRTAYLPDNKEGKEVLSLLQEAFKRKLLFTVGRSVTTGQDNQTVWNGVHHKTNTTGGSSHFGYPDLTYFDRVKLELAMKGVTLQSIQ